MGLAIWPLRSAGCTPIESRPTDTIPTTTELDALRGLVQRESRGWSDPVNRLAPELDDDVADAAVEGARACP